MKLVRGDRLLSIAEVLGDDGERGDRGNSPTHREVIARCWQPLVDVGLDYLAARASRWPTLSGGEAQRLKLAGHPRRGRLSGPASVVANKGALFVFDEPTTGLHFEDIAQAAGRASTSCWTAGHSLLVIEHNLDVIRLPPTG